MPVSLARRIKRIGLMPSTFFIENNVTKTIQNPDPSLSEAQRAVMAADLRIAAKERRIKAFAAELEPASDYRRTKDRRRQLRAPAPSGKKK